MANPDKKPCVAGLSYCGGPLSPPGTGEVCNDCAVEYERMVNAGEIVDFINEPDGEDEPAPDDDGDRLDRKFTGRIRS
jgi:hypothetical protein